MACQGPDNGVDLYTMKDRQPHDKHESSWQFLHGYRLALSFLVALTMASTKLAAMDETGAQAINLPTMTYLASTKLAIYERVG